MIYKTATINNIEKSEGDGYGNCYTFTLSAEYADRMGDVISVNGIRYKNYEKNNIVLWNHNTEIPAIGTMDNLRVEGNEFKGDVKFYINSALGGEINDLVANDVIKAGSIGFMPLSRPVRVKKEKKLWERYRVPDNIDMVDLYEDTELLEFSIANVPANQYALLQKNMEKYNMDISEKAGRVLSAANIKKINTIVTQLTDSAGALKEILSSAGYEEEPDDAASLAKALLDELENEK